MAALNEQWQQARLLRQREVVERREQVHGELESWQHDRLAQAAQLHQYLSEMVTALRLETEQWLHQTTEDRLAQIPPLRQALQCYTRQLQAETQALLADYQADRELSAAVLRQHLDQDRQALRDTMDDLRLDIAQDLRQIQEQTVIDLAGYRQDQAMMRAELLPKLSNYVSTLKATVSQTLDDLNADRQMLATQQYQQRQQDRQVLADRVDTLFEDLAEFRRNLAAQRAELTRQVWGTTGGLRRSEAPTQKPAPRGMPKAAPQPRPKAVALGASPSTAVRPSGARPPSPRVTPPPPPPVTAPSPVTQTLPGPTTGLNVPQAGPVATILPPAEMVARAESARVESASPSLEEVVYNYLHLAQGARISEIETELGISRFQAVDALHVLIQKNLIVKQDRTYFAKEEAVL